MSSRSYLSIGDVLTLLRQEFPDVTISKIRFLESQGLVNPERTPSGYRKFYEHDVERLRWVLRQQREHFLPLKVIKDRLDEDGATPTDATAPATDEEAVATAATAEAAPSEPVPTPATVEEAAAHGDAGEAPSLVPASVAMEVTPSVPARVPTPAAVGVAASAAPAARPSRPAPPVPSASPVGENGAGAHAAPAASGDPSPAVEPSPPTRPARASRRSAPTPAPVEADESVSLASMGGASLSLDDLCSASGLSAEDVVALQEYGLVSATVTAGVEFFDEEALTVATVAAKFAAYGVEARHLRLYKNAADREAGFVEQIVIPMVRQRNPEARARATRTAEDLSRLGQQLRGSLLRTALRDLLAP